MDTLPQTQDPKVLRKFLPQDFVVTDWATLQPYFDALLERPLNDAEAMEQFLKDLDELEAVVAEDRAWRHIKMTCDTQDKALVESYQFFIREIQPHLAAYNDKINRKLVSNPHFEALDPAQYGTFIRSLKKEIELFREENIPIQSEAQTVAQEFSAITGGMNIEYGGKTLTLQQAGKYLEVQDREVRQAVWEKVGARRREAREKLHEVFDQLVALRTQIARQAGFDSYTQYKFEELHRFDYSQDDTRKFHEAVETVVTPVYQLLQEERREALGVDRLRPWDLEVDIFGEEPLKPFEEGEELIDKSIEILGELKPVLGEMVARMKAMGFLDVESREGKAPGGYNYPLMETGVPFIFMNAAGTHSDVITMLHESGHAVHSFLTQAIPLNVLKHTPSEVAELASMSMELLSMDHYDHFYPDRQDQVRAMKSQLVRCLTIFPWIATVDAFQQWAYDHPDHGHEAREAAWVSLYKRFQGDIIDWSGFESTLEILWQRQIHIFQYPFYYIEYAIAQLGALAVWKNAREHPEKGLHNYLEALKLGYTQTIPEIYDKAGIRFDFSENYMRSQVAFCMDAYKELQTT